VRRGGGKSGWAAEQARRQGEVGGSSEGKREEREGEGEKEGEVRSGKWGGKNWPPLCKRMMAGARADDGGGGGEGDRGRKERKEGGRRAKGGREVVDVGGQGVSLARRGFTCAHLCSRSPRLACLAIA
jgi:hypothetical protein